MQRQPPAVADRRLTAKTNQAHSVILRALEDTRTGVAIVLPCSLPRPRTRHCSQVPAACSTVTVWFVTMPVVSPEVLISRSRSLYVWPSHSRLTVRSLGVTEPAESARRLLFSPGGQFPGRDAPFLGVCGVNNSGPDREMRPQESQHPHSYARPTHCNMGHEMEPGDTAQSSSASDQCVHTPHSHHIHTHTHQTHTYHKHTTHRT